MTAHLSCAGGIVFDEGGRLLLIQRGQPPSAGSWSIPGGRCEGGETGEQACIREVAEETGLAVVVLRWAGRVTREGPGEVSYDIDDYVCAVPGSCRTDRTGHDGTEHSGTEHDGTEHDGTEPDGTEHDGPHHVHPDPDGTE